MENEEKYSAAFTASAGADSKIEIMSPKHVVNEAYTYDHIYKGSDIALEYENMVDRLWKDQPPGGRNIVAQKESPIHRQMILLKAQGLTNKEVAAKLDMSPITVGNTLKLPWARQRLIEELNRVGRPAIQRLLDSEAAPSVLTLVEMRDNEKAKPSERISAANALLDRIYGKPAQTNLNVEVKGPSLETKDAIEEELAEVLKKEAELRGN